MISDEKKLAMIENAWELDCQKEDRVLCNKFDRFGDENDKWHFAYGYLAALRQLGPVIELVNKINETSLEWGLEAEDALRAAGLEV